LLLYNVGSGKCKSW